MRIVKSGVDVLFWHDVWLGAGLCLKDQFHRLYALEVYKECRVNDRWISVDGTWSYNWAWHSNSRGRALDDINELSQLIGNLVLYPSYKDGWKWDLDPGGVFTVKKFSKLLDSSILGPNELLEFVPSLSPLAKKVFQGVVYVAIWALWDWRNRVLHTSSSCLHEDNFAKVQTLSLL
ncbi:hypothetical protein Tco_1055486 [Tanacetum coccineum]|uniref:Reverse transcriptase zinc-binding domain-containing protein n=1 Tax=Tanacetum coccineum TaxID=301880 RepID=A0ABQ5H038_9ASTR